MRNISNKPAFVITLLLFVASVLAIYLAKPYDSPSRAKISAALDGSIWPSGIPAPAYIDKCMYKSKTTDDESVDLYFLAVKKNELNAYINELRQAGFQLTAVVWQYESERLAWERAARQDYDYYKAEKRKLRIDVSAKPGSDDGGAYIQIWGLSDAEIKAFKVQSESEEIAELGGYEVAGPVSLEYRVSDIGSSLHGHIQPEIATSSPYWLPALPAPAFIDRISSWSGSVRQSFEGVGFALSFEGIDIQEMVDYLLLLKSKGYQIGQPVNVPFYYENAKPHGALDYANFRSIRDWGAGSYKGGMVIRAECGRYRMTFSLSRYYVAQDLYKGNRDYLDLFPNDEAIFIELDVTGLDENEMESLGYIKYSDTAYFYEGR
jgi:hypothetical protein